MKLPLPVFAAPVLAVTTAAAAVQDPTMPYQYDATVVVAEYNSQAAVEWKLSGIRIRGGERTALLNGRLVRIGDSIGSATVVEINPAEVVLSQQNKRVAVKLLISDIKRPVPGSGRP